MDQRLRPIRLLLSAHLIRRVDEVVAAGTGGFASREEIVEEALNSYLLELDELRQGPVGASVAGPPVAALVRATAPADFALDAPARPPVRISAPAPGFHKDGDDVFVDREPMLGLHNRDWPSLWALSRLAHRTREAPMAFPLFLEKTIAEAWSLTATLQDQWGDQAKAATRMLPTNTLKKQAAEAGFQNFAIGSISNKPTQGGVHKSSGPLPVWRAVALTKTRDGFQICLTEAGWELLGIVDGLGPIPPHDHAVAQGFFHHLAVHAPGDWWGFQTILQEVAESPSRDALLDVMTQARDWSHSVASSATQGYIARCREWGLIEPKLIAGTYRLTEFGKETLNHD